MNRRHCAQMMTAVMVSTCAIPPVDATTRDAKALSMRQQLEHIVATTRSNELAGVKLWVEGVRRPIVGYISSLGADAVRVVDAQSGRMHEVSYSTVNRAQKTKLNPSAKKFMIGAAIIGAVLLVVIVLTGPFIPPGS